MAIILFFVGGLLFVAGFFGMWGTIIASPMVGLTTSFGGLAYSLGPFIGIGLASFVFFIAGVFLMKIALFEEVE